MICLIFSELQGKQLLILKMLSVLIPPCVGETPFLWYNYGVILVQFCALLCGFLWGASVQEPLQKFLFYTAPIICLYLLINVSMSAIKSKPIFEECFLAFKCTFPKDHITLECWRRAACVLEDVTALTTTGRNHSVLPPVDPAYRALCISLCLVLCILRPIVHWPEVTGRVCRPAPMLLKNVYK